jgi:hypothetical protein
VSRHVGGHIDRDRRGLRSSRRVEGDDGVETRIQRVDTADPQFGPRRSRDLHSVAIPREDRCRGALGGNPQHHLRVPLVRTPQRFEREHGLGRVGHVRLDEHEYLIDRDVGRFLLRAARPLDDEPVDLRRRAQPEVQHRLALPDHRVGRRVERGLRDAARRRAHERAVAVAVGRRTGEPDTQPRSPLRRVVAVEDPRAVEVRDEHVLVAVVVEVEHGDSVAETRVGDSPRRADFAHRRRPAVEEETRAIGSRIGDVVGRTRLRRWRGVGVAVGHQQIEMPVVVRIEEDRSPGPTRLDHAPGPRDVLEASVSEISIQPVARQEHTARLDVEGTHEHVQPPVAIEVGDGQPHAVLVRAHPRGLPTFGESAVAVVPPHLAGAEVAHQHEIGAAVLVEIRPTGRVAARRDAEVRLAQAGRLCDVDEVPRRLGPTVAQEDGVLVALARAEHAPLGDVDVEPTVAVVVHEPDALALVRLAGDGHVRPACDRLLGEVPGTVVDEQEVARPGARHEEHVRPARVGEVPRRDPRDVEHVAESSLHALFAESPVAVVHEHPQPSRRGREHQIGPTVAVEVRRADRSTRRVGIDARRRVALDGRGRRDGQPGCRRHVGEDRVSAQTAHAARERGQNPTNDASTNTHAWGRHEIRGNRGEVRRRNRRSGQTSNARRPPAQMRFIRLIADLSADRSRRPQTAHDARPGSISFVRRATP